MTPIQKQAFYDASGMHVSSTMFLVRLLVGGIAIICAVLILIGLMHLLDSKLAWNKTVFVICLFSLCFFLMLVFAYLA